jgi:hypothetical protein
LKFINSVAKRWHGYEVHLNDATVPRRNCLFVGYHARSSVDLVYLFAHPHCRSLIFHGIFDIPVISSVLLYLGAIPSKKGTETDESTEMRLVEALSGGDRPVLLTPGGAYECLKSIDEIGVVNWKAEPGFARLIAKYPAQLGAHTAVVPVYTRNCERAAFTTAWWYDWSGRTSRVLIEKAKSRPLLPPLCLLVCSLSLGVPFVLRPVKLDTYFGAPLSLRDGESAAQFAERVRASLQSLIAQVEAMPERPFPVGAQRGVRSALLMALDVLVNMILFGTCVGVFICVALPLRLALLLGGKLLQLIV